MTRKTHTLRFAFALVAITAVVATALAAPRAARSLRPLRLLADLASRVDLSADQRAEIRSILLSNRDEVAAVLESERVARVALRRAIQQPAVDEPGVRAASAEVAAVDARFAVLRAGMFAEVAAVLTPDQRAAVDAFVAEVRPMIAAEVDRLASPKAALDGLDLAREQRQQIRAILADHRGSLESLVAAERETREALAAAIRQHVVDEASVRAASAAVAAVDADLAVERARIVSEVGAVLTPEQRARAQQRIERLHETLMGRAMDAYDVAARFV